MIIEVAVKSSSEDYDDVEVCAFLRANSGCRTKYTAEIDIEDVSQSHTYVGCQEIFDSTVCSGDGVEMEMEARGETAVPEQNVFGGRKTLIISRHVELVMLTRV